MPDHKPGIFPLLCSLCSAPEIEAFLVHGTLLRMACLTLVGCQSYLSVNGRIPLTVDTLCLIFLLAISSHPESVPQLTPDPFSEG